MLRNVFVALALSAALIGCKSPESQVIGSWRSQNLNITFKEDKTFTSTVAGAMKIDGTWQLQGDKVVSTTKTINGQPAEQFLKQLQEQLKGNPMATAMIEKMGDPSEALKKPSEMTLSQDGKTLTAKDPTGKQTITLTKPES